MLLTSPRVAKTLSLSVLLGLCALSARAENLQELYQAGLVYDATYLSARASLDAAQYRLDQVYALRRPSVGLSVSGGRSTSSTPDAASTQSANTTQYGATVSASQTLFNRANDKTITQAEKALDVARTDFAAAEQDLIIRVSQAYFDVLAAQDTLATARSSSAAISEQVASAKRNFEVGTATITDTREAQARFDLATAQEIAADNDLVTKRIALDQLVGRSNVAPRDLAVPVVLPVPTASVEDYVSHAADEHPSVRRAQVAFEVAQLETEKARAQRLPTVDAVASVGTGRGAAYIGFPGQSATLGVQLTLPLYTGGSVQNRIKETLVLEERSRNDLDAARRSVVQTTRQAYYTLLSSAAQVKALEAAEASSKLALEATQLGYRVGIRVNVDVLNAQSQLYQTRRDLARARYDVLLATLRLRQASGQLTPSDVVAIDRLLAR